MQRSFFDYILITLKGLAIGAADVVPGVSGGTIAFISGIYEELLTSINKINLKALKTLRTEGFSSFWKTINGSFLIALFLGIGVSIFSLAKVIRWLLEHHPLLLWAFFFGLILASIYFLGKDIKKWNLGVISALLIGCLLAFWITSLPPWQGEHGYLFLFLSGALAICAMILPGISGAFILVLLGAYHTILSAISELNFKILATVGCGAIVGLLSFARLLKWMFTHYKNTTVALMMGFIIGSLNKIWPWKQTVSTYVDAHGNLKPFLEKNVLPFAYEGNPKTLQVILMTLIGFFIIFLLERFAVSLKKANTK
ncbi:DUF368 domain-containing protein [Capnocytophaga canimorsus]|uniref:DUF368 domain-containing protein n=1 Tax=Capnocytophaga canimorsus TaxID=28188 RepID=UPI0037D6BFC7